MEEKTMLEQLLAESKKRTLYSKIAAFTMACIFVVLIVVTVMVVPEVFRLMNEVDMLVDSAEALVETAEISLGEISRMTVSLTETSSELNAFISGNSQTISEAISGIQNIDVDTLNEAIKDLHDAVAPFASLMNRFK